MANVLVQESSLQDIADAIRTKNGTQNTYKPAQMAGAIEAIPSGGGITPTGTINITANGTHDVTNYASANVNVPTGGSEPSLGTKSITANGTYTASDDSLDGYSQVTVNVPTGTTPTGTKQISITANGTTTEDVSAYANAEITVNVPTGGGGATLADVVNGTFPVGEIDLTGTTPVQYALANRRGITRVIGTIPAQQYIFLGCTGITSANVIFTGNISASNVFGSCTNLTTAVVGSAVGNSGLFNGCTNLVTADLNVPQLRNNGFTNNNKLETIILRKSDGITALESAGVFNITHFKSGGTGGTIYIPKSLYDHLGDGTAYDYQSANNWSTVHGYGTITWQQIEGSQYENYYADGTAVNG